jgi:AraC-like DNA-binding protein
MLDAIIYLNPVYVTLFWAVILNLSSRNSTPAKSFLGKFMIFACIIYLSHLIFYYPLIEIYALIDPLYQFSSLMVYPMYYVYVRLLTVDESFSLRIHGRYFLIPLLLITFYLLGILLSDFQDYKTWLYNRSNAEESLKISFLKPAYMMIRVVFVIQLIYLMYESSKKLSKYKDQAGQFYSDYEDGRNINVTMINISMLLTGVISIVVAVLSRDFFIEKPYLLIIPSVSFSLLLFVIGYLGMLQKPVNPTFEIPVNNPVNEETGIRENHTSKEILTKILDLFENQKIYLANDLNIVQLANITGSNRTYISQLINQHYQQNFCSFVNSYRIRDVKALIKSNPQCTNQLLADKCGFSSTDSLKRVVKSQTGMSVTELKNVIINHKE